MQNIAIPLLDSLENLKTNYHLVVLYSEVPAQGINEVHIIFHAPQFLVFQHIKDPLQNLWKLLLYACLSLVSTAFKAAKIVLHLHSVIS